eukprot:scaffold8722_cov88-Isochrysis_galbana.AAC.2
MAAPCGVNGPVYLVHGLRGEEALGLYKYQKNCASAPALAREGSAPPQRLGLGDGQPPGRQWLAGHPGGELGHGPPAGGPQRPCRLVSPRPVELGVHAHPAAGGPPGRQARAAQAQPAEMAASGHAAQMAWPRSTCSSKSSRPIYFGTRVRLHSRVRGGKVELFGGDFAERISPTPRWKRAAIKDKAASHRSRNRPHLTLSSQVNAPERWFSVLPQGPKPQLRFSNPEEPAELAVTGPKSAGHLGCHHRVRVSTAAAKNAGFGKRPTSNRPEI